MRQVSRKRERRDAGYSSARRQVFERGEELCEFCVGAEMSDVHHRAGRGGDDPHRLDNLVGLCADCHRRAHAEPVWARRVGLSRSRLAK